MSREKLVGSKNWGSPDNEYLKFNSNVDIDDSTDAAQAIVNEDFQDQLTQIINETDLDPNKDPEVTNARNSDAWDETFATVKDRLDFTEGKITNKNYLINSVPIIWQRGISFLNPSSTYTADRMRVDSAFDVNVRVDKALGISDSYESSMRLEEYGGVGVAGALSDVIEIVEDYKLFRGQEFTFSSLIKADVGVDVELQIFDGVTSFFGGKVTGTGVEKILELKGNISSGATTIWAMIKFYREGIAIGQGINIQQRQLELGNKRTLINQKTYAKELMDCQRYYYSPTFIINSPAPIGIVYDDNNNTDFLCLIDFPVPMRIVPTVVVNSAINFSVGWPNNYLISALTGFTNSKLRGFLNGTSLARTANATYQLYQLVSGVGELSFDAEI